MVQGEVKKMLSYGVNVNKKEVDMFQTPIGKVKSLHEMLYLHSGATEYDEDYGVKKYQPDEVDMGDIGF